MSFAAEVKDFLGAAQSTYKMLDDAEYSKFRRAHMKAQTDKLNQEMNDPSFKAAREANTAHTLASTAKINADMNDPTIRQARQAQIAESAARTRKYGFDMDDPDQQEARRTSNRLRAAQAAEAEGRARVYNTQSDLLSEEPEGPSETDYKGAPRPGEVPMPKPAIGGPAPNTGYFARGGLVQKFEDGGMVEDEDLAPEPEVTPAVTPAIGAGAAPANAPTDVSAQSLTTRISHDAAHDAVAAGLKYGVSQVGRAGIPTTARQQRLLALRRGAGAAPIADMEAVYKKIDPNGQMGESERNMAALSAIYQFKMRKGDEVGAQRAAFQMLQRMRENSQRYAAIAAVAGQNGDIDGAAKAAMKAYANIPDGRDLKIFKGPDGQLQYSVINEQTGETISKGIATPQQLGAAAMGVAEKGFDQFLLSVAGQRAAGQGGRGQGGAGAGGGNRGEDAKESALEALEKSYTTAFTDKDGKPLNINPDEARAIKGSAYRIYTNNPGLTHDEAIDITKRILSVDKSNLEKTPFQSKKLDDGEGYVVKAGKNSTIRLSDDDWENLASLRAEKIDALKKAAEEEKKRGPGFISEAAGAIGRGANDVYEWAKDDLEKAGRSEFGARAKSAIGAIGRAAGDAYEWAKDDLSKSSVLRGVMNGPGKDKF